MEISDLDKYLIAKRQERVAFYVTLLTTLLCVTSAAFLYLDISPVVSRAVLIGSALGLLLANSEFGLHGTVVSRQALLGIIEAQINRDADALSYLSKKSSYQRRVA